MSERVLITGGAGFIGSHLADALVALGHHVTALDILHPQVHSPEQQLPAYMNPAVRLIKADVRDRETLKKALLKADIVFHLAAYTGVGQSMYQIGEYLDVNALGTAVLLEALSDRSRTVRKLILASSRAVYGEGAYHCEGCGRVDPPTRPIAQLRRGQWDVMCPDCGRPVTPIPTPENKRLEPGSVYGISKLTQEQACLLIGSTYALPAVSLRFFNVYGPRQSLHNPYTGVIGTFITRVANRKAPRIYEDGRESRDFIHVDDAVRACISAMEKESADGGIFNIGTGQPISLLEVAQVIADAMDGPPPVITGQFRAGDIRHCHADLTRAREVLEYSPAVSFDDGIRSLIGQLPAQSWGDLSPEAERELVERGLAAGKPLDTA